jgi:hypothetical protein
MRARGEGLREASELLALYSVKALARIGNVSARLLAGLLRSNGVTLYRGGGAAYVALPEIQRKLPSLYESCLKVERSARRASRRPLREDA